jgi:hypothetical protein
MSNILQAEDFSFLRGKEVIQICFGLYQIQMHLFENVSICWEHRFDHKGRGAISADMTESLTRDTTLLSLLGQTVERVVTSTHNALILQFSNNEALTIFVSGGPYESVSITAPGKHIIA